MKTEPTTAPNEEKSYDRWGPRPMLTLVQKDKSHQSFAFGLLLQASLDSTQTTIALDFGFCRVHLQGERLNEYYLRIIHHVTDLINEKDPADISPTGPGVTRITVTFRNEKES